MAGDIDICTLSIELAKHCFATRVIKLSEKDQAGVQLDPIRKAVVVDGINVETRS